VPGLKRCNRVADCHGGKTFWSWFCARTGRGSQVRSPSRPPLSRPKPAKPSLIGKRPFLPGFSIAFLGFFGLRRR
jgi:hypothetical protein